MFILSESPVLDATFPNRMLTTTEGSTARKCIPPEDHCLVHSLPILSLWIAGISCSFAHTAVHKKQILLKRNIFAKGRRALSVLHLLILVCRGQEQTSCSFKKRVCSPWQFGVKMLTITSRQLAKSLGFRGLLKTTKPAA